MTAPYHAEPFNAEAVLHVLRHMRAQDAVEAYDLMPGEDLWQLFALYVAQAPAMPLFRVLRARPLGRPVAIIGLGIFAPGMAKAQMLATPELTPRLALAIARDAPGQMRAAMDCHGLHRAECHSIAGHIAAHRFLARLGFTREATLPSFGRSARPYHQFAFSLPPQTET